MNRVNGVNGDFVCGEVCRTQKVCAEPFRALLREQMQSAYFSAPAIRSLRSIPFNSVLKASGLSHAGTERAWLEKTGLFFILY